MKIALCFHGLPRLVKQCNEDISKYFINDTRYKGSTIDIYGHFWYDKSHNNKVNRLHIPERYLPNENPVEIFKTLYNTSVDNVIYEDCPIGFDSNSYNIQGYNTESIKNDDTYSKIMTSFVLYGLWCRFLSATKVLELMENIRKNQDKSDYDLVIIARTDLLKLNDNKKQYLLDEISNLDFTDTIYFPSTLEGGVKYAGEHPNRLGDWLFMGTPNNIKKYCNIILSTFNQLEITSKLKSICPIHNTERLNYWAVIAHVKLDKYVSTISIRRFPTEEWENPKYISSRIIPPKFYTDNFDLFTNQYKTSAYDLLPFYTDKIKFIK